MQDADAERAGYVLLRAFCYCLRYFPSVSCLLCVGKYFLYSIYPFPIAGKNKLELSRAHTHVLHQHLAVHLHDSLYISALCSIVPVDDLYLHSMLGYAHVHKAYEGAVDRHGQQNIVFGTLVGLTK